MFPKRLYGQLFLLITSVLLISLATYGAVTIQKQADIYRKIIQKDAVALTENIAEGAAHFLVLKDYAGLDSFLLRAARFPEIMQILVIEQDGSVVSSIFRSTEGIPSIDLKPSKISAPTTKETVIHLQDEILEVEMPIQSGILIAHLRINYGLHALNMLQSLVWKNSLLVGALAILMSVILLSILLRRPMRAIENICRFALELDNKKGKQIEVETSSLEVRQICDSLNAASSKLLQSENQLLAFNERLAITLKSIGDGVIATDDQGRIVLLNSAAEKILGWTLQEAQNIFLEEIFQLVDSVSREKISLPLHQIFATGEVFCLPSGTLLRTRSGNEIPIADSASPIKTEQGSPLGIVVSFRDISREQRDAQEKQLNIERREALFQLSLMTEASEKEIADFALEEGVRLTSSKVGYLHFVNPDQQTLRLYLWSRDVLKKCTAEKVPHYPVASAGIWADCVRLGKPVIHNDYPNQPDKKGYPEGHFPVLRHMSIPVFDRQQIVAVAGVGNKEEPYGQEDMEQLSLFMNSMWGLLKRKQTEDGLRAGKEEWERTFDAIGDVITILDPQMHIVRANKSAGELFGMTPAEMVGKYCYHVFRGESSPCHGCPVSQTLIDSHVHVSDVEHKKLQKIFSVSISPIIRDGSLKGLVHIAKDITEQKKLEDQYRQAQKMEAIGTLAGGIAHDFNNILTPILGYSEMAQTSIPAGSPAAANISEVIKASKRAVDLVRQILTFSRKSDEKPQPMKIQYVIKEALKLLRSTIPTTIDIKQNIELEGGEVVASPTQIHQVIMNLCTNAYHAMVDEQGTLTVTLTEVELTAVDMQDVISTMDIPAGRYVKLMVSDTGCGMNKATVARIFEPYFTTKGAGKGTGMGLALVHGIVQGCGGFVRVESELDKGSTFNVYFPAVSGKNVEIEEVKPEPMPTGNERIFVVDDEEVVVAVYKATLQRLGYTVTAHCSSEKALAAFRSSPVGYDLVITDQAMPYLSGVELAKQLLQIRPDIPIVLCTGYSSIISEKQAEKIGIKRFAMKPLSPRDLAMMVRDVLDKPKA